MAIYLKLFNDSSECESQKGNVGRPSVTLISGNTSCIYSPSNVKVQTSGFTQEATIESNIVSESGQFVIKSLKPALSGISLTMNGVEFKVENSYNYLGFEGKIHVGFDNKVTMTTIQLAENAKNDKDIFLWCGFGYNLVPIEVYEALNLTINDDQSLLSLLSDSASTVISTVLESTGIQLYNWQAVLMQAISDIYAPIYSIPLTVGGTFTKPVTYQLPLGVKEVAVGVFSPSGGTITPIE